jgi:hypothetical protein
MENVEQLWAPISMQTERETRITKAQALDCLTAFLGDGSGTFRDHNTSAQLIRLQAALREDLVKKQTGTAITLEEPLAGPDAEQASPVKDVAGKKRKRDKKKDKKDGDTTINGTEGGDETVGDATVLEAGDLSTVEPAKKKKKSKKVKEEP